MADVTFFLDITYHASPVFSHVFRYQGGSAVVPFSADCYVDSGVCPTKCCRGLHIDRHGCRLCLAMEHGTSELGPVCAVSPSILDHDVMDLFKDVV